KPLTTAAGAGTRRHLARRYSVVSILDLADSKLFQAAVLPMIVVATRSDTGSARLRYTVVRDAAKDTGVTDDRELMVAIRALEAEDDEALAHVIPAGGLGRGRNFVIRSFPAQLHTSISGDPWHFAAWRQSSILQKLRD